jgi:hypothetical protein
MVCSVGFCACRSMEEREYGMADKLQDLATDDDQVKSRPR